MTSAYPRGSQYQENKFETSQQFPTKIVFMVGPRRALTGCGRKDRSGQLCCVADMNIK